jgi:hypothetical protein
LTEDSTDAVSGPVGVEKIRLGRISMKKSSRGVAEAFPEILICLTFDFCSPNPGLILLH